MAEVRKVIAERIEEDHSGTFDVIKFLKDFRFLEPQTFF